MTKVIGLTGAHNTGKSYLLKHFAELPASEGVVIDLVSAPRSVQAEYGKTLEEIVSVPNAVEGFQKRILEFKRNHLASLLESKPAVIVTDRSPLDVIAYAELWVERHGSKPHDMEWLQELRRQALVDLAAYSHIIFLPVLSAISFTPESARGSGATQLRHHELCSALVLEASRQIPVTTLHQSGLPYRLQALTSITQL